MEYIGCGLPIGRACDKAVVIENHLRAKFLRKALRAEHVGRGLMKALPKLALRESVLPSLLVIFFIVCVLGGGASRADAQSQIVVRIAAAFLSAAALLTIDWDDIRHVRVPFAFAAAWTALIAIQLVPLPPVWWTALPGRSLFVDAANSAGPVSYTHLTLPTNREV